MTLKIVAISDTHGQEVKNLPSADLLIHSGDWSSRGTFEETNKFLVWMGQVRMKYKKVICVPGNHDKYIESNLPWAVEEFAKLGIDLLVDRGTFLHGVQIYGMPWTPEFGGWAFNANDLERDGFCSLIPEGTDILVTHGPPHGIMDELAANGSDPGENVGCYYLKAAVERVKPKLHVFGHIHEGAGIQPSRETLFINASAMDEYYRLVNGFKVIYL